MSIALRPANVDDAERVFAYNYSPGVRAVSRTTATVTLAEHRAWFSRRLDKRALPIWIIEHDGAPVGVIRIEGDPPSISIALSEDARGRGIGRTALALACASWAKPVAAEIHETNAASRACFMASGFVRTGKQDLFDQFLWSP